MFYAPIIRRGKEKKQMSVKINSLEIENVKRVKAVQLKPAANGLTIIGGNNNNGKTSVLDAIAWTLGGEGFRPSEAKRRGSAVPPNLHIVMSNGLVVERKGKNSALKVTDPEGGKGGQRLLDEFVEQLALNLPKFMEASGKEKANTLLKVIGVGDRLAELEREEKEKYNERQAIGRIADQKEKFAREQTYYPDAPPEPVSASELIRKQQEILARNGENQRKRERVNEITAKKNIYAAEGHNLEEQIKALQRQLDEKRRMYEEALRDEEIAAKDAEALRDESTEELERSIAEVDETNRKVRANLDKEKAEEDARQYREQYDRLTGEIEAARKAKTELLNGAGLPLPGLSVEDGELTYDGQKWDNMSGSDRLRVSTAIVRELNPYCGFVLLDKLEQMDLDTLKEFGEWLEAEGLQAIATRVSTGDECSIYIEDGYSVDGDGNRTAGIAENDEKDAENDEKTAKKTKKEPENTKKWQKGVF